MTIRDLFRFRGAKRSQPQPLATDWTNSWTPRDWADLQNDHPRRDEKFARS